MAFLGGVAISGVQNVVNACNNVVELWRKRGWKQ
jgi:hypothetical protein